MGMSGDYEDAVREGATLVRVGTALFGPRPLWDRRSLANILGVNQHGFY